MESIEERQEHLREISEQSLRDLHQQTDELRQQQTQKVVPINPPSATDRLTTEFMAITIFAGLLLMLATVTHIIGKNMSPRWKEKLRYWFH